MRASPYLLTASAISSLAFAHLELGKRADFEAAGIKRNEEGFGSEPVFQNDEPAAFLEALRDEKNLTVPLLQDRSMELYGRQSCETGYWYCSAFGRCCPRTTNCCPYGYCINPGDTCCPGGSCPAGSTCCSQTSCSPRGAQCCSDGNYCEAGNQCVKLGSNGRIVCCTDLQCTAVVRSGTTSYASTTTPPPPPPQITQPPRTTEVIVDRYTTYYWTVTWWYYSYYWYIFQAQSTVTYTSVYITTTYTTTATDASEASSRFSQLSASLTFTAPAEATSLASLVGAVPSPSETPTPTLETELGSSQAAPTATSRQISSVSSEDDDVVSSSSALRSSVSRSSTSRTSSSLAASSSSAPSTFTGTGSATGSAVVQLVFVMLAMVSGTLMLWL